MYMEYSVYDNAVRRAKEKLLAKHIIELDGSGDPDIEELFTLLWKFRDGRLILTVD